jgi:Leucine-rich repeat (LRR) protein
LSRPSNPFQAHVVVAESRASQGKRVSLPTGASHTVKPADLTPIAGLVGLTALGLNENGLTNVAKLAGLTNLTSLGLSRNALTDLMPLQALIKLDTLSLDTNQVVDISALAKLTSLHRVWLQHNHVTTIAALVANAGVDSGDEVVVNDNALSDCAQVQTLKARGAHVPSDCP